MQKTVLERPVEMKQFNFNYYISYLYEKLGDL